MLVGHGLGDFALQSQWMVHNKGPAPRRSEPDKAAHLVWPYVLGSHSLIHGGAVALATGMVWLGIAETVAHWLLDYGKARQLYNFHIDQCLHIGCKFIWALCWLIAA